MSTNVIDTIPNWPRVRFYGTWGTNYGRAHGSWKINSPARYTGTPDKVIVPPYVREGLLETDPDKPSVDIELPITDLAGLHVENGYYSLLVTVQVGDSTRTEKFILSPKSGDGDQDLELYESVPVQQFPKIIYKQGEQGPAGPTGGAYMHDQTLPSNTWVINHGMGYDPNVRVILIDGTNAFPDVSYSNSGTQVTLTFGASIEQGKVYLS